MGKSDSFVVVGTEVEARERKEREGERQTDRQGHTHTYTHGELSVTQSVEWTKRKRILYV